MNSAVGPNPRRKAGILLDANLLLLLVVGGVDPKWIPRYERTRGFEERDYEILDGVLIRPELFDRRVTTPGILAEVSNLAGKFKGDVRDRVYGEFARWISILTEIHVESRSIAPDPLFARYGLTDLGILAVARDNHLVLTADGRLAGLLRGQGIDVWTLEWLRVLGD